MRKIFLQNKKAGFTLIETLVSLGILSLILITIGAFQANVFSFNRIINIGLKNQGEAKAVIRPFANEVRSAVPSNLGAYPIENAGTTTFVFYSDIDNDQDIERIRYFLDFKNENQADFKKGIVNPVGNPSVYDLENEQIIEVIHDVVPEQIFYYYDSFYTGATTTLPLDFPVTPSNVRLVKIILKVDSDPNNPPAPFVIETQASIRNLKDNL